MAKTRTKPAELISTKQAANRLGVTPNTVRSFIVAGKLKGYRVGRLVKIDAQDVEDFISAIESGD